MESPKDLLSLKNEELDQFPKEKFWEILDLYKIDGFWYSSDIIPGMLTFQSEYEARSEDIILASSMKTGTTWLKAICVCIMGNQSKNGDDVDQLEVKNPHDHIKNLEFLHYFNLHSKLKDMQSPGVFSTHLPYSALPDSIKSSDCKIVYIARNPKDTLVSTWHFFNQILQPNQEPYPFEKAYDSFVKGVHFFGPYHDHVLQYWQASLKNPHKLLFLKYEDLKQNPKAEVRKLASFLGRPFGDDDDEVDKVLWRSSFERLKNLEVNKNGRLSDSGVPNYSFFRLGNVGDWKNFFTDEMMQGLDEITRIKFEGTALDFHT